MPALLALLLVSLPVAAFAAPSGVLGPVRPGAAAPLLPDRSHIAAGTEAQTCQMPTTVVVLSGTGLCSGTLIHPRVVALAAHCVDNGGQFEIFFGEDASSGPSVQPLRCVPNPAYDGGIHDDWAVCVLRREIDLPITPVVPPGSCLDESLTEPMWIFAAGFGQNFDDEGAGIKRMGWTEYIRVNRDGQQARLASGAGCVCPGDSGGPSFIRGPDGAWYMVGIHSAGWGCGNSGWDALVSYGVPWMEEETGFDLTPCFADDGSWDPGPDCRDFLGGGVAESAGQWSEDGPWCDKAPVVPWPSACGPSLVGLDATPPSVSINRPKTGESLGIEGTTVKLAVEDDLAMGSVFLELNGITITEITGEPWEFALSELEPGDQRLRAVAVDLAGNESSAVVEFRVADAGCAISGRSARLPGLLAVVVVLVGVLRRPRRR